jgi:CysZ protein
MSSNAFSQIIQGAITPVRAVGVIVSSPKLIVLSAIPILITIVVLSLVFYALMTGVWSLASSTFTGFFADYQTGMGVVLVALTAVVFLYFSIQSLTLITSLCASPFNDLLAEQTERVQGIQNVPGFTLQRFAKVFWIDLKKSLVSAMASIVLSLFLLIPVVGVAAIPGIALITAFTFVTYPQSRRELGVRDSLGWVKKNWGLALGFGLVMSLLFAIPVLNLFALPVAVVSGTLLYLDSLSSIIDHG